MLSDVQSLFYLAYIDGLVQDCSNSSALAIANALELVQSCTKPSIIYHILSKYVSLFDIRLIK